MSEPSEAKPSKGRWTPERAGRSQGSKSASASDGGGRHINASTVAAGAEATRRRAIDARPTQHRGVLRVRSKEADE